LHEKKIAPRSGIIYDTNILVILFVILNGFIIPNCCVRATTILVFVRKKESNMMMKKREKRYDEKKMWKMKDTFLSSHNTGNR